jgi:adenylylsulfate kinase-like enzyme
VPGLRDSLAARQWNAPKGDSRYETPEAPELHLPTDRMAPEEAVERILALLRLRGCLS